MRILDRFFFILGLIVLCGVWGCLRGGTSVTTLCTHLTPVEAAQEWAVAQPSIFSAASGETMLKHPDSGRLTLHPWGTGNNFLAVVWKGDSGLHTPRSEAIAGAMIISAMSIDDTAIAAVSLLFELYPLRKC